MKNFTIILTALIAMTIKANAQIPNSGFEDWTTVGGYEDPNGWGTANSYSTSFYPVMKTNDHYPASVGDYSIRMENKPSLLPSWEAMGIIMSGVLAAPPTSYFPITGHPTSLTGYYIFTPQDDTMSIQIELRQGGQWVAEGKYTSTTAASGWTSFNIPLSNYTSADSGNIIIAAFNISGEQSVPYGNSVLYIDNLNFDNLIGYVREQSDKNNIISLYPNPASDFVTLHIDNKNNVDLTLNIYNVIGELVRSELLKQNQQQINIRYLSNGIYMVEIKSKEWSEKQKLIIQR